MKTAALLATVALALAACERPSDAPSQPTVTESKRAPAAGGDDDVTIQTIPVADGLHMLIGKGGNIGVLSGDDGVLVIDDQFAELAPKIRTAIEAIKPGPISYLINTHHHGDHTGGNAIFGAEARIIAHANVRATLAADNKPAAALPVITYDKSMTVHFNGEAVRLAYFANGHTGGDSIVFFPGKNAVHTGDHFFNGRFPYIDLGNGGNAVQLLANVDALLEEVKPDTRLIPGHGPLATVDDLRVFRTMLHESIELVKKQRAAGKSLAEIQKAGVPARWKAWGAAFVDDNRWLELVHGSLAGK